MLGIEVGAGVLVLAWLLRPDPGTRLSSTRAARLVGRFALMPPLIQGVGILALPGLLTGVAGLAATRPRIAKLASEVSVDRNPWSILIAAVGLSVGARLLQSWRRAAERQPDETASGLDAVLLAGGSVRRARAVAALRPWRWIGAFALGLVLAATNFVPSLLFTPWMDGTTIAPGMLILADGPDDGRRQAAALACCLIAGGLIGLLAARLAPAPPPEWNPDPP